MSGMKTMISKCESRLASDLASFLSVFARYRPLAVTLRLDQEEALNLELFEQERNGRSLFF